MRYFYFYNFRMKRVKENLRLYIMFIKNLGKNFSFVDPFRFQLSANIFDNHKNFIKNEYLKIKKVGKPKIIKITVGELNS